jgi:hypothetical protein
MRAQQAKKKPRYCGAFLHFLVPVRDQNRFWRRERSESKAFLTAKARAYISYASVSPAKITPLSQAGLRSRRNRHSCIHAFERSSQKKKTPLMRGFQGRSGETLISPSRAKQLQGGIR